MDFGSLAKVEYVPEWHGNRKLAGKERLALKISPMRAMDVLHDGTVEDIYAWRDRLDVSTEAAEALRHATPSQLRLLRVVIAHTSELKGFVFGGKALADPAEVWPRLGLGAQDLLFEVYGQVGKTASLTEDEVGNSDSPSAGSATPTTTSAPDVAEGESQGSASTKAAATAR